MLIAIAMVAFGCQKELETPPVAGDFTIDVEAPVSGEFRIVDGVLAFESPAQLDATLEKLSLMSPTEKIAFENEHGFRSLNSIYYEVTQAEVGHQEEFFKGLDPELEVADYERMGYFYESTPLFTDYLEKGVIKQIIEPDGSRAFDLSIDNPALENVLTEKGAVIVGDKKFVFEGDAAFEMNLNREGQVIPGESQKVALNGEFNFYKNARRPGYESAYGTKYWINDPGQNNNYRYYAQVNFSSSFTTLSLTQSFYWIARAEQKKWGNWATRNNYNPIWGISANWSYDYWVIYDGMGFGVVHNGVNYPLPNTYNRPTSPYGLTSLFTNYTVRYLHLNGTYNIKPTLNYDFFDNVRVYNDSWTFKFSGGPSGYTYIGQ
jgi:hypothetical protein